MTFSHVFATARIATCRFRLIFLFGFLLLNAGCGPEKPPEPVGPPPTPPGMVVVTGGTFRMGSADLPDAGPVHDVKIDTFFLDRMEVTNQDFEKFVNQTGYPAEGEWNKYTGPDRGRHPVVSVTWNDAAAYAKWVGKRLPTEAEWEFAARAGRQEARFGTADDGRSLIGKAVFGRLEVNAKKMRFGGIQTSTVGSYDPNPFGLYDMSGNAAEWCADWFESGYPAPPPAENPTGPTFGRGRVIRGGSWNDREEYLGVSHRMGMPPGEVAFVFGFRCASDYPKPPSRAGWKWW